MKITSFALGTERDRSESKDLRDFGYLLRELSGERRPVLSEVPSAFRRLFDDAITPSPHRTRQPSAAAETSS